MEITSYSSINPTIQVEAVVTKGRDMLAFISRTFKQCTSDIFLTAYSALHEFGVQAWFLYTTRDVGEPEKVQASAANKSLA